MEPILKSSSASRIRFGTFELNLNSRELRSEKRTIRLQDQAYRLLRLLLERWPEAVSRKEIKNELWPNNTFVDSDHGINTLIKTLRGILGDSPDQPSYIQTLPKLGYRMLATPEWLPSALPEGPANRVAVNPEKFLAQPEWLSAPSAENDARAKEPQAEQDPSVLDPPPPATQESPAKTVAEPPRPSEGVITETGTGRLASRVTLRKLAFPISLATLLLAIVGYYWLHRPRPLTGQETIVLADFENSTGDAVFDGALRQGLSAHLSQSPFLHLLSDERIARTRSLMSEGSDTRLTPEVAREVCQRTESSAVIEGSISTLGTQYVLGLKAVGCANADLIASEQAVATDREHVLRALGDAADRLRARLGESRASLQKYDVPLAEATTPSIEALRAYTLGNRALNAADYPDAIASGKHAIEVDPNFVMAYMLLGSVYSSLSETDSAVENMQKAYDLRGRVSELERFNIECHYLTTVTGDLDAAAGQYKFWKRAYPRDGTPSNNLGNIQLVVGDYDQALDSYKTAVKLTPDGDLEYGNLGFAYVFLNRPSDAEVVVRQAQARHLDSPDLRFVLYLAAYLRRDEAAMKQARAALLKTASWENQLLDFDSDTAAYEGRFTEARQLTARAVESAERMHEKEVAASYVAEAAVRDALVGNGAEARQEAQAALARSKARGVEAMAAIAMALARDRTRASQLETDLARRFPADTVVRFNYIPVVQAAIVLPGSPARALEALTPAERYELGLIENAASFSGYPVYLRGQAYLAAGQGGPAAAEFQKLIDHPGVVLNEPIGALAHLGLARAYALSGDQAKAEAAYRDFLGLWKDADPDTPIYVQAKSEYAALK